MRLSGETAFCRGMRLSAESQTLFDKALQWIPGGEFTCSGVSCCWWESVFRRAAKGASVWDADDNEYVDYVGTWGPAILGHAPHVVVDARRTLPSTDELCIPNPLEVRMAELVVNAVPGWKRCACATPVPR